MTETTNTTSTTDQIYVATDLTHLMLPANDWNRPAAFWLKRDSARRLYYRLTPAVWAWILVRLESLEAHRISVDGTDEAVGVDGQIRLSIERLKPIREWVYLESGWYDPATGARLIPEERSALPRSPMRLAELEAWDRRYKPPEEPEPGAVDWQGRPVRMNAREGDV